MRRACQIYEQGFAHNEKVPLSPRDAYNKRVAYAWIAPDGHYCFLEFRNPEEMALGFSLNQVTIQGSPLKVGKTKNSINDSMKYLSLILENKENARK